MPTIRPLNLYLDTSVIGGYFDDEFTDATRELWRQMEAGQYRFFISPVVTREIARAPEPVQRLLASTFTQADSLPASEEARKLAEQYVQQGVVSSTYAADALHVAIATVEGVTTPVSWNFKHLVSVHRESGFNAVNLLQGRPIIRIVSPLALIYDEPETEKV